MLLFSIFYYKEIANWNLILRSKYSNVYTNSDFQLPQLTAIIIENAFVICLIF